MAWASCIFTCVLYYVILPPVVIYLLCRFVFRLSRPQVEAFLFNLLSRWAHRRFFSKIKADLFHPLQDINKKSKNGISLLEIGVGTGVNFDFYPEGTKVTAIDPNFYHEAYLRANVEKNAKHVKLVNYIRGFAEDMSSLESNSFDAVVSTLTMCSVRDPAEVLEEIKRVLKPGGIFFYLEHVAAERGSFARYVQDFIQFVFPHSHGGHGHGHSHDQGHGHSHDQGHSHNQGHSHDQDQSHRHINRETWSYIDQSSLRDVKYKRHNVNTWIVFFAKPCIYGTAVK